MLAPQARGRDVKQKREISLTRLPKIDFDFEGYRAWRDSARPLVVEIGCGVGLHPILWAKQNPDLQMLAIERTSEKFEKFSRRLANHPELKNIWPAHAEASVLLPQLIVPCEVSECFYLYPNPEPKAPNRRLGHSPLLKFISSILKPGGRLTLATNIEDYARELLAHTDAAGFSTSEMTAIDSSAKPRSHFEKKYLARGESCWNVVCLRPEY